MERKYFYKYELKLSPSAENLVNFIEKNARDFTSMTINEVAELNFMSKSNISKITRKLGFKNFKEMQRTISYEISRENNKSFENPVTVNEIAINTQINYKNAIDRTIENLDKKKIYKMKKIILNSDQIYTFGIASSGNVAREMADGLNVIGYSATMLENIHFIFRNINEKNRDKKILIIYSRSFKSKEYDEIRRILNKHDIRLIILTANQVIKEKSNELIIKFRSINQKKKIIAMSSKIAQLLITDIVIYLLSPKRKIKNTIYNDFALGWDLK